MSFKTLYHGTSGLFRQQIMKHGLRPRRLHNKSVYRDKYVGQKHLESDPDLIYLTDTYAVQFSQIAVKTYGGALMVVAVRVEDVAILPDTDFQKCKTGTECLSYSGTCSVKADRLQPHTIYMLDKKTVDKIFPVDDMRLGTGIQHLDYVLMCNRKRFTFDGHEWIDHGF